MIEIIQISEIFQASSFEGFLKG